MGRLGKKYSSQCEVSCQQVSRDVSAGLHCLRGAKEAHIWTKAAAQQVSHRELGWRESFWLISGQEGEEALGSTGGTDLTFRVSEQALLDLTSECG